MTNFLRNTINRIRRFVGLDEPQEAQYEWIRIGEVSQLIVYPLLESSTKIVTQNAVCTSEGLQYENTYDGSFVIYRSTDRVVCNMKEYPILKHISIQRINGTVTLDSEYYPMIQFNFPDDEMEVLPIIPIRIHDDEIIFVRDCGLAAGEWVSEYLLKARRGMRLGYHIYSDYMEFLARNKNEWFDFLNSNDKDNPMEFHLDATNRYSLLSIPSFDKINDKLEFLQGHLMEYDFRPNIIIQTETEDAYTEFKWSEFRIKNFIFESIPSCHLCTQNRLQNYFGPRNRQKQTFVNKLQSQIKKYSKVTVKKSAATLTVDFKLSGGGGAINCGDPVYFKKKVLH